MMMMIMKMKKMIQITLLPIPNQIQSQPKQNLIQDRQAGGQGGDDIVIVVVIIIVVIVVVIIIIIAVGF
jgi:hypothetical protein